MVRKFLPLGLVSTSSETSSKETRIDGLVGPIEPANHIVVRTRRTSDQPPSKQFDLAPDHYTDLPSPSFTRFALQDLKKMPGTMYTFTNWVDSTRPTPNPHASPLPMGSTTKVGTATEDTTTATSTLIRAHAPAFAHVEGWGLVSGGDWGTGR
ncbi:hypothetical protein GALMADRAFT_138513 [Galerina marginata CBS 339.88]|uniref:Uncharacterized protein n=1 Tax=Galerina marginata (strain CBS 339.88) TaxID=685588 RepID=A0A067T4X9_GALM3|nr:hypothetical protein GALMADRAFT_138513 [Galerina marginata CBS 339.88]